MHRLIRAAATAVVTGLFTAGAVVVALPAFADAAGYQTCTSTTLVRAYATRQVQNEMMTLRIGEQYKSSAAYTTITFTSRYRAASWAATGANATGGAYCVQE